MKFHALLLCSCLLPCVMPAQTSTDPKQLLAAASQAIAVAGEGAPPFRLKASFQTFDYLGKLAGTGTVEEVFLRPDKRKIDILTDGVTYSYEVRQGDDTPIAVGKPAPLDYMTQLLLKSLLSPLPKGETVDAADAQLGKQLFGSAELNCVRLEQQSKHPESDLARSSAYCMSADPAVLRVAQEWYGFVVFYNRFARLGAHYQAQDISVQQNNKLRGKLQVTALTPATDLKDTDFPVGPLPPSGRVTSAPAVAAGFALVKTPPQYPLEDKQRHMSGVAVLHALIEKDGTIRRTEVITASTPTMADAATKAVHQWLYKPYLLDGVPVEVDTTVTVHFNIGPR